MIQRSHPFRQLPYSYISQCSMAAETTDKNISLKNVRDFLYDVRLKWYDFGIELDIPHQELDRIKAANKDDHGVCLRDMIQVRLNLNDDPLTWRHIADALNAKAINERELGNTGNYMPCRIYTAV